LSGLLLNTKTFAANELLNLTVDRVHAMLLRTTRELQVGGRLAGGRGQVQRGGCCVSLGLLQACKAAAAAANAAETQTPPPSPPRRS
jgi:hypothetical protein